MPLPDAVDDGDALRAFRTRAIRSTATTLAVVNLVLVAIFAAADMVPAADLAIILVAVVLHATVAATVGRTWRPGSLVAVAYIGSIALLIDASLITSADVDTEGFWFLLIPIGLSGLTLPGRRHAALAVSTGAAYVLTATVGGGLTWGLTAARLTALGALAWVSWRVTQRLEQSLRDEEDARREQESVNQRLRELDAVKDDFVSTVSHELRTPLTAILGLSHTVNQRWEQLAPDQRRTLIDRIEANARSLDGIIASLLDVARIERGQMDRRDERVSLGAIVQDALGRLELLLGRHDVVTDVADAGWVAGDASLLERVVDNLLTNAARHTPEGTRIEVDVATRDAAVRLSVRDHGPGIRAGDLDRLGERFYRAGDPSDRSTAGVGVGLALVTEVLRAHGTTLSVRSTPGEGSTFAFALPAADGA